MGVIKLTIIPTSNARDHWWHLTLSTLISVWPCCTPEHWSTSTRCSASDGGYLRRQKGQCWRRPPVRPHNVWLNKIQGIPTLYFYLRGAAVTRNTRRRRWDDDDDDDDEGFVKNKG